MRGMGRGGCTTQLCNSGTLAPSPMAGGGGDGGGRNRLAWVWHPQGEPVVNNVDTLTLTRGK
jgi:hypothetical protein